MADLATTDDLTKFLGAAPASPDQAVQALAFASATVRAVLGYRIGAETVVELCDPINGSFIELEQSPVNTIATVEVWNRDTGLWTTLTARQYSASRRTGIIYGIRGTGVYFPGWPESWRVTYDAGYATVPDGIKAVTLAVAARALTNVGAPVKSERIGNYSVTYGDTDALTPMDHLALKPYMRGVIG